MNSKVLRLTVAELRRKETEDPLVGVFFHRLLATDLYNAALFITQLKTLSPAERLDYFWNLIASATGSNRRSEKARFRVPLRDNQVAEILGFSTRQLKRVKKELREQGRLPFSNLNAPRSFTSEFARDVK